MSKLKMSCLFALLFVQIRAFSQNKPDNINLYIDCQTSCDINYIKTRISYINYVNDRFRSDVYLLITSQNTGSGGKNYVLQFDGLGYFTGIADTLTYSTTATATDSENRDLSVSTIERGILPYILKTKVATDLAISVKSKNNSITEQDVLDNDPWNFWVMSASLNGSFEGENNYSSNEISTGIAASRVTEDIKIDFSLDASREFNRYGTGPDEFSFINRNYDFDNLIVWSISPRFSAGGSVSLEQSNYSNYKLSAFLTPTIEYNFYPYKQAQTQAITLMYQVGPRYFNYYQETVYLKTRETRFEERLALEVRYNKPWGEVWGASSFSHYFYDLSKNRLSFDANVELRVVKGLFLNFGGSYSFKRDQLNIVKGDVTDQDLLTRRRELNSNFDFDLDFGIRYRFGSIFNNVVNPRF